MKTRRPLLLLSGVAMTGITAVMLWPESGPQAAPAGTLPTAARPPAIEAPSSVPPVVAAVGAEGAGVETTAPSDAGARAAEAPALPDFSKLDAFDHWMARWKAASPGERAGLREEGARLAGERRPEFRALISFDPRQAVDRAITRVARQDLPDEITRQLETPVSTVGTYDVRVHESDPSGKAPAGGVVQRFFQTADGTSYKAHVPAELQSLKSFKRTPLQGYADEGDFAVAPNAVRPLDVGEKIPAGTPVQTNCLVSGKKTEGISTGEVVTEDTPAVQIGDAIVALCEPSHAAVLADDYRNYAAENGAGGGSYFLDNFPGTASMSIGGFKNLYIRVAFPDRLTPADSEEAVRGDMNDSARFFIENSYGKFVPTTTFTPVLVMPHTLAWYQSVPSSAGLLHADAMQAARDLGYDTANFQCVIVRNDGSLGGSWASYGGPAFYLSHDTMGVINHEIGHILGQNHSNYWKTSDGTAYGTGANEEYGNYFDVMGSSSWWSRYTTHYNTVTKRKLGWITPEHAHAATTNGQYRIYAYDQPQLEEGKRYAFRVAKDSIRGYNVEYHPAYGGLLTDQALVIYDGMGSNAGHLIDTTPGTAGSPDANDDAGIAIGRTYSDWESDQHFTVVAKNATTPESLELMYNRGPFPGNVAPTTGLSASATTIAVGGSVTFTATAAADANGDPLAYHWHFDDGVHGTNTSTFTRTFDTAAQVNAMLTVSDMKGGSVRRSVVIHVGAHGKQAITGTVTDGATPLAGVLIKTGSKICYSNSDGTYSLPGLATGNATLTAALPGYTFAPSTANPYAVVNGTNTVNWTATAATRVTLTKTAEPVEGGANGNFRLTRTGDTAAALTVLVSPVGGTATKTTDYTFAPDFVNSGSFKAFTIPAGSATLDIVVAAVNDTAAEGPETITLQLASAAGYVSGGANSLAMTLGDNDSALPLVAVTAPDPYAMEGPGSTDTGTFTFTRTGSTAAALNLTVAWSGAATHGTDYDTLPTTVTIPIGQSAVDVIATPANDSLIEVPEDLVVTISTNAAYLRDASATTASAVITDDDTPVVTVTVPDADASEAGQGSGTFLLTRTGDTSAPLTVYYGLTGEATYGIDYTARDGQVTIPAGATSAPVVITPYDDDLGEPAETVVLSVSTFSSAYNIGSSYQGSITITDNNDPVLVAVHPGAAGIEGGANPTVIFRSIGAGAGNVTVNYTVTGTATPGSDFTALAGTVSVPVNGSADTTVTIPITNDAFAEATETVVITITPGAGYKAYNDSSATAMIRDNDSGGERVMVSRLRQIPLEAGPVSSGFYFSRAVGTAGDLTVGYTVSGTATNGTDYANLTGTCVIPAGAAGVEVALTPVNDTVAEGSETVTVTVNAGAGYGADYPASATHEIADNDAHALTVGFGQGTLITSEQPGALGEYRDLPVTLSAASADTVTVRCLPGGGTALGDGIDWAFADAANANKEIPDASLTFPPGTTSQNLRIRVKNDGQVEGPETAVLKLAAAVNAGLATNGGTATVEIFDGQIPSMLVTEERWNNTAVYTNNTWNTVAANYNGQLASFTPPQNVADNYARRLTGLITAPATGTYNFWIAGDDAMRLYLSTDATAANKSQIAYRTTYTSFQNWDASATQKSANINLVAGQSYYLEVQHQESGGGDHVSVAWEGPGFSRIPITSPVIESAPRSVGMLATATTRTEADDSEPLLQVVLDRPAGSTPITVNYSASGTATQGSDYTLAPGTLTFAAGEQMKPLPLSILADALVESPEAIVVTLANPSGAQLGSSTHVITLRDADTPAVETLVTAAASSMDSGTVLGTVLATPAPGRNITGWEIIAGNTGNTFALDAAGQLTLVTPAALPNPGGSQLVVRATDNTGATGDGLIHVLCNAPANGVVEQRWNGTHGFQSESWTGPGAYTGTLATFTTGQNVADDYSRRLTGYLKPTVTGDYTFWIAGDDNCRLYLSSDGLASNKSRIAFVDGGTGYQAWDSKLGQKSAVIPLVAGKVYWMEVHHLEGGWGDHVSVAWQGPGISRQAIPSAVIFKNVAGVNFDHPPLPPTLALASPVNGAEFDSGEDIAFAANLAGGSIAVTAVEFYRGATLIGSDNSAPYSVTWNDATTGNHVFTAKAIYSGGAVTSSAVTVSVQDLDPAGDPDGDGFTTGLELALGTDPHSSASQPSALYANLRAWWKLDESSGTTADDSTGRVQDGSVSGAAWSNGITGGALDFDGIDDGVLVGTSAALTGSGDFSLAAWVKVDPGSPTSTVIQQREPGASGYQGEYMLNVNSSGTVNFFVYGTSAYQFNLTTAAAINDGQWHHLAAVRSGTSGKVYIDGVEVVNGSGAIQALQSRAVSIGYDHRDSNKRFAGLIDDVRIYERALSAGEIDDLHDVLVPNRAPSFTADPTVKAAATEDAAYTGSLAANASDPDFGDAMTFAKVSGPAWLAVAGNGALTGTPGNGNVGPNSFIVRVTDPSGLSDDAVLSITVDNANDAPVFAADPISGSNATEDAAYSGTLAGTASDIDAGDTPSYSKVSGPAWLSVGSNGTLSGTPGNGDVGPNSFTVRVTDGGGVYDEAVFNVAVTNVNDAPVFAADPVVGGDATEDTPYSGSLAGTANDIDADDTLAFAKVSGPAWLSVASNGALTGTPSNSDVGSGNFTVRVTDAAGLYAETTLAIAVANVNDAPVFDPVAVADFQGANEDAIAGEAYGSTFSGTASDEDGDSVSYTKQSGPAWLVVGTDGSLSGTPAAGDEGTTSVTIRATDPSNAWAEASFDLTVIVRRSLAVNYRHSTTANTAVLATENTNALNTAVGVSGPVVWNNQEINGTGGLLNGRGAGTYSGVSVSSFSSVPYQQGSASLSGSDASQRVFRYYLDDGDGGSGYFNGDGVGASIHLTGLTQFLSANRATSYTLTLLFNADSTSATPFLTANVRNGVPAAPGATAISSLPSLGTITPQLLGDGKQPLPNVDTNTTGKRGWGRLLGLTANSITIAMPVRSGSTRGSVAGFIITPGTGPQALVQDGYRQWQSTHFGASASDPAVAHEDADPNADGVPNLLAYTMGIDPLGQPAPGATAAQRGRLELVAEEGTFHFDYQRDVRAIAATLVIEETTDLADPAAWSAAVVEEQILSEVDGIRTIRAIFTPDPGEPRRFFRLRAIR
jgi:hypothetical protein